MRLDAFDFDLPEDLIALRPVEPRRAARLLVSGPDGLADRRVEDLPGLLTPKDLLIFNDTAVLPVRLTGTRHRESQDGSGRARVEVTLLTPQSGGAWQALAKPAKRLRPGDQIVFSAGLSAEVLARDAGAVTLQLAVPGDDLDAALDLAGEMPLPPYIAARRAPDAQDRRDYQSVFARQNGSVAAPTASLHFDAPLLAALRAAGIPHAFVTLHVGAGTFLPVKADEIEAHRMHAETGRVSEDTARRIAETKARGGRVIAVGTTALRLIETAALAGTIAAWEGDTDIFIRPGHRFHAADGLMTNFHLPKSTLIILVAALIGLDRTRALYAHAVRERYRFYSYGDATLLWP